MYINMKYHYLEKGYFLSAGGHLCSNTGGIEIDDVETCKKAAKNLKQKFNTTVNKADRPKGCYLSGVVDFNQHLTGSNNYASRQICKLRGNRRTFPLPVYRH